MKDLTTEIRLSLQKALIRNISQHVRGICCDWADDLEWFKIIFYLDVEANEEEKELQSVIMTEFHNDLQGFKKFYEECIYSEVPFENLDKLRLVIFWRNE